MNLENVELQWAHDVIERQAALAAQSLRKYCKKPKSAKRLHSARKGLARLRAALQDLGETAAVDDAFYKRVQELHSAAGKVRDSDVLLDRLAGYRESASHIEREELCEVEHSLRARRKKFRRKLQTLLDGLPELHA